MRALIVNKVFSLPILLIKFSLGTPDFLMLSNFSVILYFCLISFSANCQQFTSNCNLRKNENYEKNSRKTRKSELPLLKTITWFHCREISLLLNFLDNINKHLRIAPLFTVVHELDVHHVSEFWRDIGKRSIDNICYISFEHFHHSKRLK